MKKIKYLIEDIGYFLMYMGNSFIQFIKELLKPFVWFNIFAGMILIFSFLAKTKEIIISAIGALISIIWYIVQKGDWIRWKREKIRRRIVGENKWHK